MNDIDKAEKAAADLRDLIRQAHETLKDGRQLIKDMKAVKADLEQVAKEVFDERMTETVRAGLDEYGKTIGTAIEAATEAVMDRFTTISNTLMYGNKQGRGENILEEAVAKSQGAGPARARAAGARLGAALADPTNTTQEES